MNQDEHPRMKELIATADAVAKARIPERLAEIKRSEETDRAEDAAKEIQVPAATPYMVGLHLARVGVYVPTEELAKRTLEERRAAILWAVTCDSEDPFDRPEWLPGRDTATAQNNRGAEIREQGMVTFRRKWHDDWDEPPPPLDEPEPVTDDEAALLDILEEVDEIAGRAERLQKYIRLILGMNIPEAQDSINLGLMTKAEAQDRADTSVDAERTEPEQVNDRTSTADPAHRIDSSGSLVRISTDITPSGVKFTI